MSRKPSAAELLGNAGELPVLKWKGKEYRVCYPCLATVKRVELRVAREAMDMIADLASVLTPQELADQKATLQQSLAAGHHAAGGPLWERVMSGENTLKGHALTLWACLMEADPECDLTPAEVRAMFFDPAGEAGEIAALITPDFTRAVGKRLDLPAALVEEQIRKAREGPSAISSPKSRGASPPSKSDGSASSPPSGCTANPPSPGTSG